VEIEIERILKVKYSLVEKNENGDYLI